MAAYRFARLIGSAYLRLALGVSRVTLLEADRLAACYREFAKTGRRLLILFRHVSKEDGPVVVWSVAVGLRRWCRRSGVSLPAVTHTHFLYGKDVLNWAGALARWAFPRIGGIPVMNGRADRQSLSAIRRIAAAGDFPLALAPEAQVTYHTFRVAALAGGAAAMAAWMHNDSRSDEGGVTVLPVAIGFDYGANESGTVADIVARLEKATGRPVDRAVTMREALLGYTDALLGDLEAGYSAAWPELFRAAAGDLQVRIDAACDGILACAESAFGYRSSAPTLERIFRLRYRLMESVYREDLDPDTLPPSARGVADHRASVAAALTQHGEIVDLLEYVRPDYIDANPSVKRLAEYGLNLLDLANRMTGGNINSRYSPKGKRAYLLFGKPIDASGHFRTQARPPAPGTGTADAGKSAVASLNELLRSAFDDLVVELETIGQRPG